MSFIRETVYSLKQQTIYFLKQGKISVITSYLHVYYTRSKSVKVWKLWGKKHLIWLLMVALILVQMDGYWRLLKSTTRNAQVLSIHSTMKRYSTLFHTLETTLAFQLADNISPFPRVACCCLLCYWCTCLWSGVWGNVCTYWHHEGSCVKHRQ